MNVTTWTTHVQRCASRSAPADIESNHDDIGHPIHDQTSNDGRPASELPDVASFRVWAGELAALLAHHVAEAGEGGLASAATYSSSSRVWTQPRWQLLLHQANHQMQHRSEIALWLTQLGCSPGNLDMLFYLREQEAVR